MIHSLHISVDGDECLEVYNDDVDFEREVDSERREVIYIMNFAGDDGRRWQIRYVRYSEAALADQWGLLEE